MLETIVRCSGPDIVRDAELFEMSKALEMSPVKDIMNTRIPENWAGGAHTYPRRSIHEVPWSLHCFKM